jgi:hypothetical protein
MVFWIQEFVTNNREGTCTTLSRVSKDFRIFKGKMETATAETISDNNK